MCAAREQLIADMTCYFWQQVSAFPYVVTPALRSALGEELRRYIASGLTDLGACCALCPPAHAHFASSPAAHAQFAFFLYGGAGTGKSTLVAAFAQVPCLSVYYTEYLLYWYFCTSKAGNLSPLS
jgi:hypothetical protein